MNYDFANDFFTPHVDQLSEWVSGIAGKDGVQAVEIGSFDGRSAVWFLENVLTGNGSKLHCIDNWSGSGDLVSAGIDMPAARARFLSNTKVFHESGKLSVMAGDSISQLSILRNRHGEAFDFVYVDASHTARDVLLDCCLAFRILKVGGLMVCDDYGWGSPEAKPQDKPKLGIDSFMECHSGMFDVVGIGYRACFRKCKPSS